MIRRTANPFLHVFLPLNRHALLLVCPHFTGAELLGDVRLTIHPANRPIHHRKTGSAPNLTHHVGKHLTGLALLAGNHNPILCDAGERDSVNGEAVRLLTGFALDVLQKDTAVSGYVQGKFMAASAAALLDYQLGDLHFKGFFRLLRDKRHRVPLQGNHALVACINVVLMPAGTHFPELNDTGIASCAETKVESRNRCQVVVLPHDFLECTARLHQLSRKNLVRHIYGRRESVELLPIHRRVLASCIR